jgi:tRNA (cmo5U34)-methyltransferase
MTSWTFDTQEIADTFDQHVREQLPWYDMVTDAVCYITRNYLTEGEMVVDIGASTGNTIACLKPLLLERNAFATAIEVSETMAQKLDERFLDDYKVTVRQANIIGMPLVMAQVHILFLTMMFIPVHKRIKVLNKIRENTKQGGVIIIVDKVCDHSSYFGTVLKRLGMHWKIKQGAKLEDVAAKEMSLAGVQIPFDAAMIPDAKQFFRMGEFAGWVIET